MMLISLFNTYRFIILVARATYTHFSDERDDYKILPLLLSPFSPFLCSQALHFSSTAGQCAYFTP